MKTETKNRLKKTVLAVLIVCMVLTAPLSAFAETYERVIAHGGGAIEGNRVTNSLDAVYSAIDNGFKLIELDMLLSTDGEILMVHDWTSTGPELFGTPSGRNLSYKEYAEASILEKYEPLTLKDLIDVLRENPDVRIVTDVKDSNVEILTMIAQRYPAYINRFVPQIYSYNEYDPVKALGYKDIILTLYRLQGANANDIIAFVQANNIYAVTIAEQYRTSTLPTVLRDSGIIVYMHTINGFEEAESLISLGAYGVYSDDLVPSYWEEPERTYYLVNTTGSNVGKRLNFEMTEGMFSLQMRGQDSTETVHYYIDETLIGETKVGRVIKPDMEEIQPGKHLLRIEILSAGGEPKATVTYYIWYDDGICQVVAPPYAYLLEDWEPVSDFAEVMETEEEKMVELLGQSFIARAGSAVYYYNGKGDIYFNDKKLFPAFEGKDGRVTVAFSASALKMGATSVYMDDNKTMRIRYNATSYSAEIGSGVIQIDSTLRRLYDKFEITQGRAVSTGEALSVIFDRPYVDKDGILIILPKGTKLESKEEKLLLETAAKLYQQPEAEESDREDGQAVTGGNDRKTN